MNKFLSEILNQPQALSDTLNHVKTYYQTFFQKLRDFFKEGTITNFIFTGMGSSYFCSYIPYYILNQNGINVEMRESGEFLLYSFPEKDFPKGTAIILVSQSGESGEIVQIIDKIKSMKNPPYTIGITNTADSILAKRSDMSFLLKAGEESSVTSKTYVCTLLFLYIFAKNLNRDFFSKAENLLELEELIKEINYFLDDIEKFNVFYENLLNWYGSNIECLEILARGPSLATAYQAALNFKEIVKEYSEANPCSTFRHGCIECLKENSKLIIISSESNNFKLNIHFINQMINWDCGKIIHVTNEYPSEEGLDDSKVISFKHNITNPFLSPIMEIIILQIFFYKMAEKKGLEPGKFKFSQKITKEI